MNKRVELRTKGYWDGYPCGYIVVQPTGRWKIVTENGHATLYLETGSKFTKNWVHENDLWIVEIEEFINDCSG